MDTNGDVLRRLVANGDNLNIPRHIDFVVGTPTEQAAEYLADTIGGWGYAATIEFPGGVPSLPWEVKIVRNMVPTHEGVTGFENELAREAARVGGRNDSSGCFSVRLD